MINGTQASGASGTGGALSAAMAGPGGAMGKEEFLQLLVAQLTHQDPMNPMQGQDLAVQLAQFSSVEQLIGVNDQLSAQSSYSAALAQAMNSSAAVGALGHSVIASGDQVALAGGSASILADVGGAGGTATVRLYDQNDELVREIELGSVAGGRQTLQLDGLDDVPDGTYRCELDVKDGEANEVSSTTLVSGTVSGVKYGMNGPVLVIGAMEIPLGAVLEISAN